MTNLFDEPDDGVFESKRTSGAVFDGEQLEGSLEGSVKAPKRHRALRAFGGLGLTLLVLVGAVAGWGYLKFRAIPKIAVDKSVFGKTADPNEAALNYDDFFETTSNSAAEAESTEVGESGAANTTGAPLTAPTVPPTTGVVNGELETLNTVPALGPEAPEAAPGSGTSDTQDTLVPNDVNMLPVDTTPVTIDPVVAEAMAAGAAEDDAEVKDPAKPKTTKAAKAAKAGEPKVVFDKVGPGPIVKLTEGESFGGPGTTNYLMIGVDDRKAVPKGQDIGFGVGKVDGSRTDTILVLRIDANARKAWILSIPRDLWVPLATSGRPSRINSAFVKSPEELVKTVQQRLGIPIKHLVQVDFAGFQKVVSTVGGVEVCFPKPTRDLKSGLNRPNPGCQMLDARGATAYVRSRHYQQLDENGVWREDPRSDLGRIIRQQAFIRSVMSRALDQASNPLTVNAMLDDLKSAVAIDTSFSFPETTALANDLRSFDPNSLEAFTLPTVGARVNGAAVLKLNTKKAALLLSKFR
jgi:LCP family protein required for cell wall assembly